MTKNKKSILTYFFPFLRWFPMTIGTLRADLIAGTTVALVLIPQSMAYAQLAGLPAYYGLYAAFLPVMVAALWGSSNQLSTGPAALSSLLTASILAPFAVEGTQKFIELAIMLALVAGVIRILLGALRMGIIVNFLSYPVVVGFTNAAAIIIGLSQLDKLLGVVRIRNGHLLTDIFVVLQKIGETHLPTLLIGLLAFATIVFIRKVRPQLPGVLIAVPLTILISWLTGFQQDQVVPVDALPNEQIRQKAQNYLAETERLFEMKVELARENTILNGQTLESTQDPEVLEALYKRRVLAVQIEKAEKANKALLYSILGKRIVPPTDGTTPAASTEMEKWRIVSISADQTVKLSHGGKVVGAIPAGLPELSVPKVDFDKALALLPGAFILVLIGFVEALSIAKAIATKTRQRLDVDQEMIGIGVANVVGSFNMSYPVAGSFSRSAINLAMGAKTGFSSVVAGSVVMLTLLFFTGAFYLLPESVLAAVIISSVTGLINFRPFITAWKVNPFDAVTAIITFVTTLAFAPNLQNGVYLGASLAMVFYLVRRTKPRAVLLGRHWDGTLHDAKTYNLPTCDYISIFRFDGSLDYADVSFFENIVMKICSSKPKTQFILVVSDGINYIDASGLEMLRNVYRQLQEMGVQMVFTGLKRQIMEKLAVTGFLKAIGRKNIFRTDEEALQAAISQIDDPEFDPDECPLHPKDTRFYRQRKKQLNVTLEEEMLLH